MKYPCNMIKDLLPLYHDQVASKESADAVNEHLCECEECKAYYEKMQDSDGIELAAFDETKAMETAKSYKKVYKSVLKKACQIVGAIVIGILGVILGIYLVVVGYLKISSASTWEKHQDISEYGMLDDGSNILEDDFVSRNNVEERIWPEKITEAMNVEDYLLIYYCPWDSNYLGYLTVEYDEMDYEAEVARLKSYPSTEYIGNYGATGFEEYEVLAMYSTSSCFTYALTDGSEKIIYVGMIFPGYAMDIDYEKYVPEEYLPAGLDLSEDNPTRQMWIERFEETKN